MADLGKAYVQIIPSAEGISGSIQKALGGEVESAGKSAGSTFSNFMGMAIKAGTAAVAAATTAMTAFGVSSVKTGMEFDSAMSQVAATLGLTMSDIADNVEGAGDTFQALRDKAREMGGSTIFSAQEAAEGLNILAMSGYDATSSMEMIEDVLHLAAAGSMDMASAAGYVSGAMKGFNDATKDSGYYADLMAKGATLANTSVAELGEAMSSGAAGAAAYGQTADSMTVSLLRLAEQGEVGSAAGTALAAAMKNLYTPTDQAALALGELGVSAYDSSGSARDFNDVVNDLSGALSGMSAEEANAYKQTIFGIQGLDAFNKMTVTGIEKQEEWAAALAGASDGAGEAAQQYDTMTANLEGALAGWGSAVSDLQIEISDQLTPTLREFVDFGTQGVQSITAAFQSGGLAGALDAFGAVFSEGLGMAMELLPEALNAGSQLLGAIAEGIAVNLPTLTDALLSAIQTVLNSISNNIPEDMTAGASILAQIAESIITAIPYLAEAAVSIVAGLGEALLNTDWSGVAGDLISSLSDNLDLAAAEIFGSEDGIIAAIGTGITEGISELASTATRVVSGLLGFLSDNASALLASGAVLISSVAGGILNSIPELTDSALEIVESLLSFILDSAPSLLSSGVELISNVVNGILQSLPELVTGAGEIIDSLLNFIIEAAPTLIASGVELIGNVVSGVVENLPQIVNAAVQVVDQLLSTVTENAPQLLSGGIALIGELASGLIENIPEIVSAITQGITQLVATITEHLPEILQMGIELLAQLAAGIIQNIPAVLAAIPQIFSSMVGTFTSQNWGSIGSNILSGIAAGIRNGVSTIMNAAREAASSALSAAKNFLGIHSPSRKFRDEVGKMVSLGIAKGMVSNDALRALDDAAAELTGKTVEDLKTMVNAWNEVYDNYYEGLEHQNFLLERNNGDPEKIIANYKTAQQALHEQKLHYLRLGVDANDKAIRDMEEQWWKYQDEIDAIYKAQEDAAKKAAEAVQRAAEEAAAAYAEALRDMGSAFGEQSDALEHSLWLAEKNNASMAERLKILNDLQAMAHNQADIYRALGFSEDSPEIRGRQKLWWGYEDEKDKLLGSIQSATQAAEQLYRDFTEDYRKATDTLWNDLTAEYQDGFNKIMSAQQSMQSKLAGTGDLFRSYTSQISGRTYIGLNDLEKQTEAILDYGNTLEGLRGRGIDEDLMQEILGLDMDQGGAFAQRLLNMSDKDWDSYMAAYKAKLEAAASVAEKYYQPDLDELNSSFREKAIDGVVSVYREYAGRVPEIIASTAAAIAEQTGGAVEDIEAALSQSVPEIDKVLNGMLTGATSDLMTGLVSLSETNGDLSKAMEYRGSGAEYADDSAERIASAIVTGLATLLGPDDEPTEPTPINLDGVKIGEILLEPLRRAAKANPEVSVI